MGCVYLITSPSGKQYVGMTTRTLEERQRDYRYDTRASSESRMRVIILAMRKYGFGTFEWEILFESDDVAELCAAEIDFIDELRTLTPRGYNMALGGAGAMFTDKLEAHRVARLREAANRPEVKAKKAAAWQRWLSIAENKEQFRESIRKGRSKPEARLKYSDMMKQRWSDPDYRDAVCAGMRDYWATPEGKASRKAVWTGERREAARLRNFERSPELKAKIAQNSAKANKCPAKRAKGAISAKKNWQDDSFREKVLSGVEAYWSIPANRLARAELGKAIMTPELRARISDTCKALWNDDARQEQGRKVRAAWSDSEKRARWIKGHSEGQRALLPEVLIEGKWFRSAPDAAEALGLSVSVIKYRAKSGLLEWSAWRFKGQSKPSLVLFGKAKKTFCEGRYYDSGAKAAEAFGVNASTITNWCTGDDPSFCFVPRHNDPECDAVEECWALLEFSRANPNHPNVPAWARQKEDPELLALDQEVKEMLAERRRLWQASQSAA